MPRIAFFMLLKNSNIDDWTAARTHMDVKQLIKNRKMQEKTINSSKADKSGGEL